MTPVLIVLSVALWALGLIWLAEYRSAKARIKRKVTHLSCGYVCDYIPAPEGFRGDVMQEKIIFNHIALMPNGEMELSTNKGRIPCPTQSEEFKRDIKLFLNGQWRDGNLQKIPPSDFIIEVPRE